MTTRTTTDRSTLETRLADLQVHIDNIKALLSDEDDPDQRVVYLDNLEEYQDEYEEVRRQLDDLRGPPEEIIEEIPPLDLDADLTPPESDLLQQNPDGSYGTPPHEPIEIPPHLQAMMLEMKADQDTMFENITPESVRAFQRKWQGPEADALCAQPDHAQMVSGHQARMLLQRVPMEQRLESMEWLKSQGCPPPPLDFILPEDPIIEHLSKWRRVHIQGKGGPQR